MSPERHKTHLGIHFHPSKTDAETSPAACPPEKRLAQCPALSLPVTAPGPLLTGPGTGMWVLRSMGPALSLTSSVVTRTLADGCSPVSSGSTLGEGLPAWAWGAQVGGELQLLQGHSRVTPRLLLLAALLKYNSHIIKSPT